MYESCQELLRHVLDVHGKTQNTKLLGAIHHLFECANQGDCPVREDCLIEVTAAQTALSESSA